MTLSRIQAQPALLHILFFFFLWIRLFPSKVYKYSRVNQSVVARFLCEWCEWCDTDGGLWQKNMSPRGSHLYTAMQVRQIENQPAAFLFCLLVCSSPVLPSLLCAHFCCSVTPFFYFRHSQLFSWNEASRHRYAHLVHRAYFNTYVGLYPGRGGREADSVQYIFDMLQPGVCWVILMTNILFYSCMAEDISALLFWFMIHPPKNSCVWQTKRERGARGVVAELSKVTLKQERVNLKQRLTWQLTVLWERSVRSYNYGASGVRELKGPKSAVPDGPATNQHSG